MSILDAADDFDHMTDSAHTLKALARIAREARKHDGIRAHVTRTGTVLLTDRDGAIRSVRSMRAALEWLGY
jgi:hypothetical protein